MSYSIVKMEPKIHRDAVQELWARNLSRNFDSRFVWLYEEEPHRDTQTWLAIDETTQNVVGAGSVYPRDIYYFGKKITIGIAADFAINREHRVFGPALKLQQTISQLGSNGYECIFAYPNKTSKGIFKRAGYQEIGHSSTWVKLLHTQHKLIQQVRIKLVAALIAMLLDQLLIIFDKLRLMLHLKKTQAEVSDICENGFNELWENAKASYSITGERNPNYLNWRYADYFGHEYRFFCLYDHAKKNLLGYIVFYIHQGVAEVVDLFSLDQDATLSILLLKFSLHMRKEGMDSISLNFFGNATFLNKIKKLLFFQRSNKRTCMMFIDNRISSNLRRELTEENNWFLFEGEMDL